MARREIKKILMVMVLTMMGMFAIAQQDNYEVLFSNSERIKIGNQVAKKGLRFNNNREILMPTEQCALEVRNLNDGTTELIVGEKFRKHKAKTLGEYLIAEKHLSTSSFGGESSPYVFDTVYYMLDTLRVSAPQSHSDKIILKAVAFFGNDTVTTSISRSKDKTKFLILRTALGKYNGSSFYLDIFEKDLKKDWEYAVWRKLYVVPLPLK